MVLNKVDQQFKQGKYGTVFFNKVEGTAIKVFRKSDLCDQHVANVYSSEVEAYKLVQNSDELKKITPKFYGEVNISSIHDQFGNDLSPSFYLDKAYKMEYIEGVFIDFGSGSMDTDERLKLINLFKEDGIEHITDSSVILEEGKKIKYIVDFAKEEFELNSEF
ncbi:hypothetical protein [Acinetobacter dispersus]|uniref:Protein kinase domain-containing protein n=1 Tax=Acinetobacter dispersus TaxID=70348 RepID=N9LDQ4_9GAMM|nr:hypothetical protein [Acinetobacter dispersus]ENW94407.1 hypothetical protein F904_01333 [Acinetobacter dispersus]